MRRELPIYQVHLTTGMLGMTHLWGYCGAWVGPVFGSKADCLHIGCFSFCRWLWRRRRRLGSEIWTRRSTWCRPTWPWASSTSSSGSASTCDQRTLSSSSSTTWSRLPPPPWEPYTRSVQCVSNTGSVCCSCCQTRCYWSITGMAHYGSCQVACMHHWYPPRPTSHTNTCSAHILYR